MLYHPLSWRTNRSALRRSGLYGFCCRLACVVLPAHSRASLRPHTTEELRERKEITDAIVANLRFISEHAHDLAALERQTGVIEANLRQLRRHRYDDGGHSEATEFKCDLVRLGGET